MAEDTTDQAAIKAWPRPVTAPIVSPESKPFWDACAQGKFLFKQCTACGEAHFYPRSACPFCYSEAVEWREAAGDGEIYSFTIVRRSPTGPFAPAYVELKEGPRVFTNIVHCDFDRLRVGQKVKLVFQSAEGGASVPMFAPV